jgi:glucose/arabinose dehydrogenase
MLALVCAAPAGGAQSEKGSIPTSSKTMIPALGGELRIPEGFKVEIFADSIRRARWMALGPDGAVYVTSRGQSHVLRLADTNNDGKADTRDTVVRGVEGAHGMVFRNGYLYIAALRGVWRAKLDGRGWPAGAPEQLNEYPATQGHNTRTLVFGRDGAMYVTIGSSCNICLEPNREQATVMRFDEHGKNGRVYSAGLRNAVGIAMHPTTGEIWVSQHERDNLRPDHQNLPHEEINILRDGGHFGWPYCHGDRIPNPDPVVADSVSAGVCARTLPPALTIQAHAAPLGLTFLDRATNFPAEYRGDALLALHGSWNRDVPVGANVVRIRVRDGRPIGYEEFVTGWQREGGSNRAAPRTGRPVDVLVYRDGSVLISDDGQAGGVDVGNIGRIHRVYR